MNPTLPIVKELVSRGEEVWYFCSKRFEADVLAAGANFLDLGEELESFMAAYKALGNHPFYTLLEYIIRYDEAMLPRLFSTIERHSFDYVVYDSFLGGGYFLRNILKIPVICSNSTFVMSMLPVPERMLAPGFHPQLDAFYEKLQAVCDQFQVPVPSAYELFLNKGELNLVYTSKEFNSDDAFDDSYAFVGPSLTERTEDPDFPFAEIEGKGVIYISLGTINTDHPEFYKTCIDALKDIGHPVILSVGKKCDIALLGEIPDTFIVRDYVPQLDILRRSVVFISHCGFNSVSEALFYGVPVIAVPMVNDQFLVAKRLEKTGAGITLQISDLSAERIKKTVSMLLTDQKYKDASARIGETFRSAGGYNQAVDRILALVEESS
jgi:MGT family glycosyltransferase